MTDNDLLKFCMEYLSYNEMDGTITWKKQKGAAAKGSLAGYEGIKYCQIRINKKLYGLHRIVWLMNYGALPRPHVDHIDHNGLNNRIENLREVSHQDNFKNRPLTKNNTSGQCGVYFCKERKKWAAFIRVSGKMKALGRTTKFEDAVKLRKNAEEKYGYHENHGKVGQCL